VESSVDGYVYVLHQENEGQTKLLFPFLDQERKSVNNYLTAHTTLEVPAPGEFEIFGKSALEIFTLIVSRARIEELESLKDLPTDEQRNLAISDSEPSRDVKVVVPVAVRRSASIPTRKECNDYCLAVRVPLIHDNHSQQ